MNDPISIPGKPEEKVLIPAGAFEALCINIHKLNARWWQDPATGRPLIRNEGEMLMLMTSELAEALEADRKNLKDSHLPQYDGFPVELIDCIIRVCDRLGELAMNHSVPVAQILYDKCKFNAERPDHKPENRMKADGKKY